MPQCPQCYRALFRIDRSGFAVSCRDRGYVGYSIVSLGHKISVLTQ